mgnify:CR=1 FL=1
MHPLVCQQAKFTMLELDHLQRDFQDQYQLDHPPSLAQLPLEQAAPLEMVLLSGLLIDPASNSIENDKRT